MISWRASSVSELKMNFESTDEIPRYQNLSLAIDGVNGTPYLVPTETANVCEL